MGAGSFRTQRCTKHSSNQHHTRGGSVVDYWQVPTERPTSWPDVRDNTSGLQRFVYARMDDFLRKVSAHVSIGRAWRNHKVTDNYFVLCREG